ncbi:KGK domain-containing protein [Trichocoleus sp. FACHB-262]|uniref:KGK domain-containing protein n=1 Tax=Trichocoleus sp. FACHB-262 TaxID=2692869 RepID=UPI001685B2BB|nr:KGK domain-containing protein [Trichocoleus sp. FACHB-262]MBD2119438.1 hypothetical protein [Trichocoleus sp. FACHB-262]
MENHNFSFSFSDESVVAFGSILHKAGRFREALKVLLTRENISQKSSQNELKIFTKDWFGNGIDCEVLELGDKAWRKGKIKIKVSIEFHPDESEATESPLDDIRQAIAEEN